MCKQCDYLTEKLTEEAFFASILLETLVCIVEPNDPTDPVKIAQETLEAYAARGD